MSPLAFALVAETLALIAALYFLIMRQPAAPAAKARTQSESSSAAGTSAPRPEQELERARRAQEIGEAKAQIAELKDALKKAKRERYEQRQSEKAGTSLQKEREVVERAASQQLEAVRAELAQALVETGRLRSELEMQRGKKPTVVHVAAPVVAPPAPVAAAPQPERAPEPPRTRELNPAEVARIELLENRSNKDRARAVELDTQVKRLKANSDIQARAYKTLKTETDLLRDKYKALEKRLNRTLLERDLTLRAIQQLERESGKVAEHTKPTADELAATDRDTEASQQAEAAAEAAQEAAAAAQEAAAPPPPPEAPAEEEPKAVLS